MSEIFKVSIPQYNYLQSITQGLSKADYKLFCHIFVSTITRFRQTQENSGGWIPIPKRFIQDKFRTADPSNLERHGLIDIRRAYTPGKQPRCYRLKDGILEGYVQASLRDDGTDRRCVSIVTGKSAPSPNGTSTPLRPSEPPSNDPEMPKLIKLAIERFRVCYFDRPAVLEHLNRLRASTPTPSNRSKYLNDWFIMDTLDKLAEPAETPGIYRFKPSYTIQATGRIGTPLQNASRAMKRAAYGSIANLHNYDLASSQMALLLLEFELYRIPCPWLEEYVNDTGKRDEYARIVGVSVDTWKTCLYSILMTGYVPTNIEWKDSPVVDALAEEIVDVIELRAALGRLRAVLKPLTTGLKLWHRIIESQVKREGRASNMFGIQRPASEFDKTSKIAAHILQGSEAYFIHLVTVLSWKYGFEPIANEHDGLITIGKIPDEAVREAQRLTGLHCLDLREKALT
jgi:hypothetical protein